MNIVAQRLLSPDQTEAGDTHNIVLVGVGPGAALLTASSLLKF